MPGQFPLNLKVITILRRNLGNVCRHKCRHGHFGESGIIRGGSKQRTEINRRIKRKWVLHATEVQSGSERVLLGSAEIYSKGTNLVVEDAAAAPHARLAVLERIPVESKSRRKQMGVSAKHGLTRAALGRELEGVRPGVRHAGE